MPRLSLRPGHMRRLTQMLTVLIDHGLIRSHSATRLHVTACLGPRGIFIEVSTVSQALLWGGTEAAEPSSAAEQTGQNLQIVAKMASAVGGCLSVNEGGHECCLTLNLPAAQ